MTFTSMVRLSTLCAGLAALSACGTTYQVTETSEVHENRASLMFAEERNPTTAKAGGQLSARQAAAQFERVARRVEPVAERFCKQHTVDRKGFNCDIQILVDGEARYRNAYQTYGRNDEPLVIFTTPMIADARNEDEIAFVMGHEVGHHLAEHLKKQEQQAVAGALILGMAAAYAGANSDYTDSSITQQNIENAVYAGSALGRQAFSQTYELESDVIGTYVTKSAGYDPVNGVRFFARPENPKEVDGQLSFWGTHPPDEKRIATVLATVSKMEANQSGKLTKVENNMHSSQEK